MPARSTHMGTSILLSHPSFPFSVVELRASRMKNEDQEEINEKRDLSYNFNRVFKRPEYKESVSNQCSEPNKTPMINNHNSIYANKRCQKFD